MPRSQGVGVGGQSFKEVWLPDAAKMEHDRQEAEYMKSVPAKMRKNMPTIAFRPPWTSIGIAPTAEQLKENNYGGSA